MFHIPHSVNAERQVLSHANGRVFVFCIPHSEIVERGKTSVKAMRMARFLGSTFCIAKNEKIRITSVKSMGMVGFPCSTFCIAEMHKPERQLLSHANGRVSMFRILYSRNVKNKRTSFKSQECESSMICVPHSRNTIRRRKGEVEFS